MFSSLELQTEGEMAYFSLFATAPEPFFQQPYASQEPSSLHESVVELDHQQVQELLRLQLGPNSKQTDGLLYKVQIEY